MMIFSHSRSHKVAKDAQRHPTWTCRGQNHDLGTSMKKHQEKQGRTTEALATMA